VSGELADFAAERPVELDDVVDVVDNLTYRIDRALSRPVRGRH